MQWSCSSPASATGQLQEGKRENTLRNGEDGGVQNPPSHRTAGSVQPHPLSLVLRTENCSGNCSDWEQEDAFPVQLQVGPF